MAATQNAPSAFRNRIVASGTAAPSQLIANERNWRKHPNSQADGLTDVLKRVGWVQDVIVNKTTGKLVDGHLRVKVALSAGEKSIPVKYVELSEEEEAIVLATIDPLGAMADTDKAALAALLEGIRDDSLADLIQAIAAENYIPTDSDGLNDDLGANLDLADELLKKWKVKKGDIWTIGRHALLCGDSGQVADVERLTGGSWLADQMLTDPPYGVDYGAKNAHLNRTRGSGRRIESAIEADKGQDYRRFFTAFLESAPMSRSNTVYVFMSGQELHNLRMAFEDSRLTCSNYLVWTKNNAVLGRQDYNAQHEFIVYGWKGRHKFYGATNSSTVLEFDRPRANKEHPTMKPVQLLGRLIQDGSPIRGKVYDAFLGSGSTMVAAEQTGRECRGIEIEPKYCAVVLERMTSMGLEAKRA